jgi:hypothetical protein
MFCLHSPRGSDDAGRCLATHTTPHTHSHSRSHSPTLAKALLRARPPACCRRLCAALAESSEQAWRKHFPWQRDTDPHRPYLRARFCGLAGLPSRRPRPRGRLASLGPDRLGHCHSWQEYRARKRHTKEALSQPRLVPNSLGPERCVCVCVVRGWQCAGCAHCSLACGGCVSILRQRRRSRTGKLSVVAHRGSLLFLVPSDWPAGRSGRC